MSEYHQEANKLFTFTESILKQLLNNDSSQNQLLQRAMIENKCRQLSRENVQNNELIKNKKLNEVPMDFLEEQLTDYDDIYFFEKWAHHPKNSVINHGLDIKPMNIMADSYLNQLASKKPPLSDPPSIPLGPKVGAKSVRFHLNEQPTQSVIKDTGSNPTQKISSQSDTIPKSNPSISRYGPTRKVESLERNRVNQNTSADIIMKPITENKITENNSVKTFPVSKPRIERALNISFSGVRLEGTISDHIAKIPTNRNDSLKNIPPDDTKSDSEYLERSTNSTNPSHNTNSRTFSNTIVQNLAVNNNNVNQSVDNPIIKPIYSPGDRSLNTFNNNENIANEKDSIDSTLSKISRNQENIPERITESKQNIIPASTSKHVEHHKNPRPLETSPNRPKDKRTAPQREQPKRKKFKKNISKEQLIKSVRISRTTLETLLGPEPLDTNGNTFEKFHQIRPPSPKEFPTKPRTTNSGGSRIHSVGSGQKQPTLTAHPSNSLDSDPIDTTIIKQEEDDTIPGLNGVFNKSNNRLMSSNDVVRNNPFIFNQGVNPKVTHTNLAATRNNAAPSIHHNNFNPLPKKNPFTDAYTVKKENASITDSINPLPKKRIPKALKKMSDMVSKYQLGDP